MASMSRYDLIKETAAINIEKIFTLWGLKFTKINPDEYDFISPFRDDKGFGACRFNTKKGRGADFAGIGISSEDISKYFTGFDADDFGGLGNGKSENFGFDIISLCMRINKLPSYYEGACLLANQLNKIQNDPDFVKVSMAEIENRRKQNQQAKEQKLRIAISTWDKSKDISGTLGEVYLKNRAIILNRNYKSIKFHPRVMNKELGEHLPTLLFKVCAEPGGQLRAIHRIYLNKDGKSKAKVDNPKMALGDVIGSAIWFGERSDTLCISEGPENALSILCLGFKFVCSTISAGNFSNLIIPKYVTKIILFPDADTAGRINTKKAKEKYSAQGIEDIKTVWPIDGDFNDMLMRAHNSEQFEQSS